MIFVTVGMQMPFDRLVRTVDDWAARRARRDVFAQIGDSERPPSHLEWTEFLDPASYRQRLFESRAIVTHAGMGTILTALEFGKPILMLPRRGHLQETRNDHQVGTARALVETTGISIAWDEQELLDLLDRVDRIPNPVKVGSHASIRLLTALRQFIRGDSAALSEAGDDAPSPPRSLTLPPKKECETGRRAA